MSKEIEDLLRQLMGGGDAVAFSRVEFSTEGRSFVAYTESGDAYGGDLTDTSISVETAKERLLNDVTSGALGLHFSIYEPCPAAQVSEMRGRFTDWEDIYTA